MLSQNIVLEVYNKISKEINSKNVDNIYLR